MNFEGAPPGCSDSGTVHRSSTQIHTWDYVYDAFGNLTERSERTQGFATLLGHMIAPVGNNGIGAGSTEAEDYVRAVCFDASILNDGSGHPSNRLNQVTRGGTIGNVATGITQSTATMVYDGGTTGNGNVTDDGTYLYTYDPLNRLVAVRNKGTNTLKAQYFYDSAGERAAAIAYNASGTATAYTQYLRSGATVIDEKTWALPGYTITEEKTYITVGGAMAVTRQTGGGTTTYSYYATDHLGTVRCTLTTDASGTEQSRSFHDFEPFGLEIPVKDTTSTNTHRFTGQERDSVTGNDYMHFRYYGSNLGRFMKPDVVMANLMNPQTWNLYSYVGGNPVNFNDPTGHLPASPDQTIPRNPADNLGGQPDGTEGWDAEYMNASDTAKPHNAALAEIQNLEANWSVWGSPMAASGIATYHAGQSTGTWDDATQTMTVTANGYWTMSSRYWAGSSFAGASTELGSIIGRVWLTQIKYKFPWYVLGEGCYQAAYALQRDIQAMKPKYWVPWIGERDSPPWPHYFVVLVPTEQNPMFGDPIIIDPYVGFTVRPFPSNGDYHLGDTGSYPLGR